MESSPDAVWCLNSSVVVRSRARPNGAVSFDSLSKGTDGVDVSSNDRFVHDSCPVESLVQPNNPISEEVPSPTKRRNLEGSQCRSTTLNESGGRRPGYGRYGDDSFTSVSVFVFESNDRSTCVCSDSAVRASTGAHMQ